MNDYLNDKHYDYKKKELEEFAQTAITLINNHLKKTFIIQSDNRKEIHKASQNSEAVFFLSQLLYRVFELQYQSFVTGKLQNRITVRMDQKTDPLTLR